jgi:hypothetical protein
MTIRINRKNWKLRVDFFKSMICLSFTVNSNVINICIPGHFFNIEHSPYLFPMFSFKKYGSMHVCNHVTKITKIST